MICNAGLYVLFVGYTVLFNIYLVFAAHYTNGKLGRMLVALMFFQFIVLAMLSLLIPAVNVMLCEAT